MKTLYLSYDGMTDPLGQSQVLPYLVGLSKKGISVTLISFEKKEKYDNTKKVIELICKENNINWIPLKYTKSPPIISTIKDIYILKKEVYKIIKNQEIKLIHCRSYITTLIGLQVKKQHNIPLLFDMRGFWANERIDGNIWKLSNPIFKFVYNFFKKKEVQYLTQADYTVSLTHTGKSEIESWKLEEQSPIEVIPCCTDTAIFNKNSINNELRSNFETKLCISEDDFIVSYLGSIGTWYMLDEMLDFFNTLLQTKPAAKFLFISQDDSEYIKDKATSKGINDNKIIVQSAQRNEVASLLSLSTVSIFFIKPLFSKKASSATKMGEIMNLGIPIICNDIGDQKIILQDICPQMIVNEFNNNEYKRVIHEFDKLDEITINKIREKAKDYFSLEKGIEKYYNIYQSIVK